MSENDISTRIRELRDLQRLMEEAEAEAETLKDMIKSYMGDTTELRAGEYKITWKKVVSSKLDSRSFRAAMPDVYSRYCKESVSRPFKVF